MASQAPVAWILSTTTQWSVAAVPQRQKTGGWQSKFSLKVPCVVQKIEYIRSFLFLFHSVPPDSSSQSKETSTHRDCGTDTITTPLPKQTPNSNTSVDSTQPSRDSLNHDSKASAVRITGGSDRSNPLQTSNYATVFITPVQVQLNGSALPSDGQSDSNRGVTKNPSVSLSSSPATPSPNSPLGSLDLQSSPDRTTSGADVVAQRLTPDGDSTADTKPPSPVPDGYHTPTFPLASYYYPLLNVPRVPYTGYTAVTIPINQPPLPEKKRLSAIPGNAQGHNSLLRASSAPSQTHHVTFSSPVGEQNWGSTRQSSREEADIRVNAKFVQDSSKFWYKPGISRDQGEGSHNDNCSRTAWWDV